MHIIPSGRLILVSLVLIWLEVSIFPIVSIHGIRPDLFFIFLAFYAFYINYHSTVSLALFFGLAKDLFSNSAFGLETSSLVIGSALLQYMIVRIDREKKWMQAICLFAYSWVSLMVYLVVASFFERKFVLHLYLFEKTIYVSLYTMVLGMILYPFLNRWLKPNLRTKQYELF